VTLPWLLCSCPEFWREVGDRIRVLSRKALLRQHPRSDAESCALHLCWCSPGCPHLLLTCSFLSSEKAASAWPSAVQQLPLLPQSIWAFAPNCAAQTLPLPLSAPKPRPLSPSCPKATHPPLYTLEPPTLNTRAFHCLPFPTSSPKFLIPAPYSAPTHSLLLEPSRVEHGWRAQLGSAP
jgi:hypothetical protein